MRTGQYSQCPVAANGNAWGQPVHLLDYHCYTTNSYGNTWTYLRNISNGVSAWVYDGHLLDGGSTVRC